MAEETQTDIFQQQKKTIDTLMDVLQQQGSKPQQIVYSTPAAQPKPTNYVMYIAIAVIGFLLLRKK